MEQTHHYELTVEWQGNRGHGTTGHRDFDRIHEVTAAGKQHSIAASSDPALRGDADRWNPEELLVASLSECHMLWFLHLAASAGVVVTGYVDHPVGTMVMDGGGSGRFTKVLLRPEVTLADESDKDTLDELHERAGDKCFIARSVNFPVEHS